MAASIQGMTSSSIWSSVVVASKPRTRLAFSVVGDPPLDVVLERVVVDEPQRDPGPP
jgi:hypothetical protein